jgi:two-component system, LytTR family, response regulator LytT
MILNCIAIDDEPLALSLVCKYIGQTPFLNLVGQYASAVEALKQIHAGKIDLIYLDIQMPDLNGIELARVLNQRPESPRIVFTTAFEQFGLEGYKVDALDYLLKPFSYEEFMRTANKALNYSKLLTLAGAASDTATEGKSDDQYLFLKVEYQWVRVALDDIEYIEGLKDYVRVHLRNGEKSIMSLMGLKELEDKLSPQRFMRVHRSYIVALDKISSMTRNSVQVGNISIIVGNVYKDAFTQFLEKWTRK